MKYFFVIITILLSTSVFSQEIWLDIGKTKIQMERKLENRSINHGIADDGTYAIYERLNGFTSMWLFDDNSICHTTIVIAFGDQFKRLMQERELDLIRNVEVDHRTYLRNGYIFKFENDVFIEEDYTLTVFKYGDP